MDFLKATIPGWILSLREQSGPLQGVQLVLQQGAKQRPQEDSLCYVTDSPGTLGPAPISTKYKNSTCSLNL